MKMYEFLFYKQVNYALKLNLNLQAKNMNQSDNFDISNQDISDNEQQFANVLNTILPEIEMQLMKDIERQLQSEFQQKYLKAIQQISNQALQQYKQAVLQLEESRNTLEQQKQAETQKQIYHLQATLASLQQNSLLKLQQKFLEENFDSRIMIHERILLLEKQIQQEIFTVLEQKHQVTKQRQLKELIIAHETKQIKLRKQLDTQIKSRIYCSSGLEELKQEIKQSRTQIGSQKSQYNLKLKKIETEIKDYQDKIKQYQKMGDIKKLRERHQQLRVQLIEHQTERQLEEDQRKRNQQTDREYSNSVDGDNDSLDEENYDMQQYNQASYVNPHTNTQISSSKTMIRQQKNHILKSNPHINREYIPHDEQDDFSSQHFVASQPHRKKFDLTAYFKGYLLDSQTAQVTQSQNIIRQVNQQQHKTLLNLGNLSEILKQKVALDPLERYLNNKNQFKQNDINIENLNHSKLKTSNFAELYGQHLKNLNKGFGKKYDKKLSSKKSNCLSQMAKKTIIKNLSLYHRNNFNHTQNHQNSSKIIYNVQSTETQNFNSYQSNLLGSYK